ncbi:sterile alpha motif domain-containing protein 9-like isoform X2 [Chaetodon auriga]|uniref:sterile alpha motif domain-containing protein 9-like isoform X2 n=1 Tax=Chaetodon auriga TaxID=39042 RepID=UPI004032FA95
MAHGPTLSANRGGEIPVGSEIRDSVSRLDVLYANQFEGESFDRNLLEETEENFYRGAPPQWLNFHISEQAKSDDTGAPFIKRDGYDTLVDQILKNQERKHPGISTVKLFHQPGCGGTTLAMQVLWDLRKTFRCAVLTGSSSDITEVAKEVVCLFTAGSGDHQNTVLLLLNDEPNSVSPSLEENIMMEMAELKVVPNMPVAILLSCVRKDLGQVFIRDVVLRDFLSDTEKQKFAEKKEELSRKYSDKHEQFHGFNIMQTNFSQDYIKQACAVFSTVRKDRKPLKTQLAALLSLLNAYVPGSYLLESQCLDLWKCQNSIHRDLLLEERMKPFSHLIITFQQDKTQCGKKVRMAHPMIAQCCTELMAEVGLTRSETARNLLTCLCKDEVPPFLLGFVKDMLTKRKPKENNGAKMKEDLGRFSRLILDIQKKEDKSKCVSVLKMASKTFVQNPFFPQALARFYYIELKDYKLAEMWAKTAKQRDPHNSFVADTLGQVYKNHLMNMGFSPNPADVLQLAKKAIEAFKHEEQLAENDMKEDGNTNVSRVFNARGMFGYLQVCNCVFDQLVSQKETWEGVLTKNVSMASVLESLGGNELLRFNDLIRSLRPEVEKRCAFYEKYLTYSKVDRENDDPAYIDRDVSECFRKYVRVSKHVAQNGAGFIQKLQQNLADTSAGVPSCLEREYNESELKEITTGWEEIFLQSFCESLTALRQQIPLSPSDAPELHLVTLLLCWPSDSEDKGVFDLRQLIQCMQRSYEHAYKKYFKSRYLRPLFFIGKGRDLSRIVHRKVLQSDWSDETIFQDPMVQERLLQVEGVVKNYRVFATVGGKDIEVDANQRKSLWKPRQVSFYLGFTIRGPVAFCIKTKSSEKGISEHDISKPDTSPGTDAARGPSGRLKFGALCGKMDSTDLTKLHPEVSRADEVHTYSLQSEAGKYECSVSALRWVCKERVSFQYQFRSWQEHMKRPQCIDYMPAGPLLDITVTDGEIEEVHLPHCICMDQKSTLSDAFAVLHVDARGVVVESVPEVTTSHIKFLQPIFLPRGVMVQKKPGVPVYCDVLIYKTKKEFLTLDVYLVPRDPAIKQEVEQNQSSRGSIIIQKPGPDKVLQTGDHLSLSTDRADAIVRPRMQDLRCDSSRSFEVFIRNADSDFTLRLEREQNTIWTCTVHRGDYQNQSTDLAHGKKRHNFK